MVTAELLVKLLNPQVISLGHFGGEYLVAVLTKVSTLQAVIHTKGNEATEASRQK